VFGSVTAVIAAVLLLTGCGGDDATEPDDGATTAPADDATTAPTDEMTAAEPTEAVAPTEAAGADFSAAAGSYAGTWTNTTFGSNGAATFDIALEGETFTATIDLAGGVFGEGDPDPFTIEGGVTADGGSATGTSDLLGAYTFSATADGSFTLEASDVPSARIATFSASGTIEGGAISGTYSVTFEDGGGAEGTFELTSG
jgi:hypothetical protein